MRVECGDCDWTGDQDDLPEGHHGIEHLSQRIDPGSEVPAGECPECGCLCYVLEEDNIFARDIRRLKWAMKAIKARIHGQWDCPELVAFGPLSPDTNGDILRIIEKAKDWRQEVVKVEESK